jgi:pimeloyl-ACP methyl ester carboxylesterase
MLRHLLNQAAARFDQTLGAAMLAVSRTSRESSRAEALGHADRMKALEFIRGLYDHPQHFTVPSAFFSAPGAIDPRMTAVRSLPYGPGGSDVADAFWESGFAPYCDAIADRYLAHEHNRTAAARLFLHKDAPRPAALLLHGYRCGWWALEERTWPVRWLLERGLDVAIPVLPFHAVRSRPGGRPVFPSSDPRVTIEGFRQAVHDLRALIRYLRERGAPAVGVMGMSLGAYTGALLATLEAELGFAVPIIPLASIADLARDGGRLVGTEEERRLQHEAIEAAHRVVSPLGRPPAMDRDRILVIGAAADRITPIEHARRLAAHFNAPLEVITGGHLLQFGRADAFRSVGRLLGRLGLLAPRRA